MGQVNDDIYDESSEEEIFEGEPDTGLSRDDEGVQDDMSEVSDAEDN